MNYSNYNNHLVSNSFTDLSIDKKRLPSSGLTENGVPSFVAEWLLDKIVPGSGVLNQTELEIINNFVQKVVPKKNDNEVIKFRLSLGEIVKIIALMQVRVKLEQNKQISETIARIPVLNFNECCISCELVERYETLLRQGIWGKITLGMNGDRQIEVIDFDPFQCSKVDLNYYAECRAEFNTEEWRDLMFSSMGFNPEHPSYNIDAKTWVLARLLPLVERNYHIIELAPKGTGKSFVFENLSNKISVLSGGKVTPARLFVDGKTKEIGLLGSYETVVLDEVQSLYFNNPEEIIGPLKTYLANGYYNRSGFAEVKSDCSLVMLANIELNEQQLPKNQHNILADLPKFFHETAFIDRFAGILPGWKIPKFTREMIASVVGLKMDFFGEVLLSLRHDNRFYQYAETHTSFDKVSIRDQKAILKSASGFLKILYPHLDLTLSDYERDCLKPAVELRQAIRDFLYNCDSEFKQYGKVIYAEAKS